MTKRVARSPSCSRPWLLLLLLAPAAVAMLACGGRRESGPQPAATLETVDVGAAPDAGASLAGDGVERRRAAPVGVAGVVPAGFPGDLPLPRPSSLVDVGTDGAGRIVLTLDSPRSCPEVERELARLLAAAGWQSGPLRGEHVRGGRVVAIAHTDRRPGCRTTVAAPPS